MARQVDASAAASGARFFTGMYPNSTLAQWVLFPLLLCILLAAWLAESERERGNLPIVVLGERKPIVAVLHDDDFRVVDAVTGKVIVTEQLPLEKEKPSTTSPAWDWKVTDWPGARDSGVQRPWYEFMRNMTSSIQFWPDEKVIQIDQVGLDDNRIHTFVSLETNVQWTWNERLQSGYSPAEFARYGKYIVGVKRQGGPDAVDAPSPPIMAIYDSMEGEVSMVFDPQQGESTIADDLQSEIIKAFASQRWKRRPASSDDAASEKQVKLVFANAAAMNYSSARWEGYGQWTLNDGGIVRVLGAPAARSRYWFTKGRSSDATRARWPFQNGDAFTMESGVSGEAAVVGTLRLPNPKLPQVESRSIYWDLRTAKTLPLHPGTIEARKFDNRLLARTNEHVYWINLETAKKSTILRLNGKQHPVVAYVLCGWIIVWALMIRATRVWDFSRSFAILLALLFWAAIASPHWSRDTYLGTLYVFEFLVSGIFLAASVVLLIVVTVRRSGSLFLLGAGWSVAILLAISLVGFARKEVNDPRPPKAPPAMIGFGGPPVPLTKTTLIAAIWYHLTEDTGVFQSRLPSIGWAQSARDSNSGVTFVSESHAVTFPPPP
jgi:hypothetical protein